MEDCSPCPQGEYQPDTKKAKCKYCPTGKRGTKVKAESITDGCEACAIGQYQDIRGQKNCQLCQPGKTGKSIGANDSTGCQACPSGFKGGIYGVCSICDKGKTATTEGATKCDDCDAGTFGSTPGNCTVCPSGWYQAIKGQSDCVACPVNTYLVDEGKSSLADCISCAHTKTTGAKNTGNTNISACVCKKNIYYQDKNDCIACPKGGDCGCKNG